VRVRRSRHSTGPGSARAPFRVVGIAALLGAALLAAAPPASATPRAADSCTDSMTSWVEDQPVGEPSDWHPSTGDGDSIELSFTRGASSTVETGQDVTATVGFSGSGLAVQGSDSTSVTFTSENTESHTFTVPEGTALRVTRVGLFGVNEYHRDGPGCVQPGVYRVEVTPVSTGYRVERVDRATGQSTTEDYSPGAYAATPTF
jgi:hypothetical protein